IMYTDGNEFALWRDGKRVASAFMQGDVRTAGKALTAGADLLDLVSTFYDWIPIPPLKPRQLAETAARLCRLLREQVIEQLARNEPRLTSLKADWGKLLFPEADSKEFADGYAQAVTFGLLMARARDIPLTENIEPAAKALRKTNTLIGSALALFTEEPDEGHPLATSLRTLARVLGEVNWHTISKDDPEAWLYFYELFLQQYDTALRKKTGSYYTPPEVVSAMVSLVDQVLRSPTRFGLHRGLAAPGITLADPAVGTGTFLLGVLRRIADAIDAEEGEGARPSTIIEALKRLVGFEMQFGPFAVAQLRLFAEVVDLTTPNPVSNGKKTRSLADASHLRLYVADTLADPDEETAWIPTSLAGLAQSRKAANAVKRKETITVVIGNPPYKEKAKGMGGWVENRGSGLRAPLDDWQPPPEWGVGAHAKHLRNLYVYFWRWAAWKVFGGDPYRGGTDISETKWTERRGVVCFITVAGFLNGPGFQKMRADLRRDADEIFVIDCSPEGHQPLVSTRIFQDVQQPVCIVLAFRRSEETSDNPATVRFRTLSEGSRELKFQELAGLMIDDQAWIEAPREWRAPFLPAGAAEWVGYPALEDLFEYNGSGVMTGRTWVIAPDAESLRQRWLELRDEPEAAKQSALFHPHVRKGEPGDKHIDKAVKEQLARSPNRTFSVRSDKGAVVEPVRFSFRSFDRQWIIPDARLINQPNPYLWKTASNKQVYLTALMAHSPSSGPALTVAGLIPDLHHYKGSFGGRTFPLWADSAATKPNIPRALLSELSAAYGRPVLGPDLFAYIVAVAGSPAYTERFRQQLKQPGLRIPITAERALFDEAVELGREIVWLHTFGERFGEGRPPGPPRVDKDEPTIPAGGALPDTLAAMPHELDYEASLRRLMIGTGFIANVAPKVWAYEVSGKNVLRQWWSYRRQNRSKPPMGDKRPPSKLSEIQPTDWLAEYTTELLALLRVLTRLVALEPRQADLLTRIVNGPTIDSDTLRAAGSLSEASAETTGDIDDEAGI
ncbi:MAG: N-6 DNA methylase, partial [Methylobacteriaceae bacterium]|nr:N-6 DNA methylase [Methylobacteriaceae bacterium]